MGRNSDKNSVFFNNNYYNNKRKKNKKNNQNYYNLNNNQYYDQNYNQYNQYNNPNNSYGNNQQNNDQFYGQYSSVNNNNYNYNQQNNNGPRFDKNVLLGVGIVLVVIILLIVIIIITINNKENKENKSQSTPQVVYSDETKRVGDSKYGYVTVPGGWISHIEETGPLESGYQYSDPNDSFILTVSAFEGTDAINYLNVFSSQLTSGGFINVSTNNYTLDGHEGYQVTAYNEVGKFWIMALFFYSEDNYLHFVGVEGEDIHSEYFSIPYSFSLNR